MTKLEVIISKHVYTRNHIRGIRGVMTHLFIAALRLPALTLGMLLNALTLGRSATLRVRQHMLLGLLAYYAGVMKTRSWLSPRARSNQLTQS